MADDGAQSVDIDSAFDNFVRVESATAETIRPHLESTGQILATLGIDGAVDAFNAMSAAREDFLANASNWNQYAMDENVMWALCVKVTAFFGASRA
jgi:hypothetical protein